MLSEQNKKALDQRKFEALCSVHLHQGRISKIEGAQRLVDILVLCVPILLLASSAMAEEKNSLHFLYSPLRITNEIMAVFLLALGVYSLIKEYRPKLKQHQKFLGENLPIIDEIDQILRSNDADERDVRRIEEKTTNITKAEMELMHDLTDKEKHLAARLALRQHGGTSVVCPICQKSPWRFQAGKSVCEMCGNALTETKKA
jgi:mobilome CxxCx(11)CxxC protein